MVSSITCRKLYNRSSTYTICIGLTIILQAGPSICELQQSEQELEPIK